MSDDPRLSIPFADEAGDGEARWIRLEQVEMPDEGVTMEDAAELIDELYGINACEDGLGNGGEEADEEDLPEEEEFLDMASERLGLDICDQGESATWEAEVDVFRSHRDDGYSLQGERIEVGATTPMSKTVTETVEVSGASYDLQWPYGGGIVVSAGRVKEVRGSTINFAAPVRGRVRISYTAVWDRVKLTVRRGAASADANGVSLAGVFDVFDGAAKSREDDSAASVVAFWRDLAAECALTRPPEDEQEIDQAEIERLCNRKVDWHVEGECWQTIEIYNLCNCSGLEAPDAPEPVDEDAPCPEGTSPGAFLGVVRRLGEYVDCEGEDEEGLNDPEFFTAHCCEEKQYSQLPRCRETREPNRGGKEIENGPEHWKSLYGENVRLTPVTPEGGCGEIIKIWAVPKKVEGPPELPEKLRVGSNQTFSVTVLRGGRPPFTWITPDRVTHLGDAAMGFMGVFKTDSSFRKGILMVKDVCGRTAECLLDACGWIRLFSAERHQRDLVLDAYGIDIFNPPGQPYIYDTDILCDAFPSRCYDDPDMTKRRFFGDWRPGSDDSWGIYRWEGSPMLCSPDGEYLAMIKIEFKKYYTKKYGPPHCRDTEDWIGNPEIYNNKSLMGADELQYIVDEGFMVVLYPNINEHKLISMSDSEVEFLYTRRWYADVVCGGYWGAKIDSFVAEMWKRDCD